MDSDKTIRKIVSVSFADIKGYTAITRVDESKAFQLVKRFKKIVEKCVDHYSGEIVQFYGDGVLIIHDSVIDSINCSIDMQMAFQNEPKIPVKIGIHFGDVILSNKNVYGDAVNVASRIQDLAEEESIIVSDKVFKEIENHPEFKVKFISEEYLKNVNHKLGIYAIDHKALRIPTREFVHEKAFKPKNRNKSILYFIGLMIVFSVIGAIFKFSGGNLNFASNEMKADGIDVKVLSVFPFKNFTGDSTLSEIGSITAYKLISSLKISDDIILVDYSNIPDQKEIKEFKLFNAKPFTNNTGASHVINGEVYLSDDTLVFHSRLQGLAKNNIVYEFQKTSCGKEDKLNCIDDLANHIKGYLAVQESNISFLRNPTYDAYKHAIIGLDFYKEGQFDLAIKSFEKSIEADSSFIDPYLEILDIHYYLGQYKKASNLYESIIKKFPAESLSERERNMLRYDYELQLGNNKEAFKAFQAESIYNPHDLENSTTLIIQSRSLINNPNKAIELLKEPRLSKIDFSNEDSYYHVYRLNVGIWAYVMNGQLKKAKELIKYYPNEVYYREVYETQLLLYANIDDTVSINRVLDEADLSIFNKNNYLDYWVVNLFDLQGKTNLRNMYADRALKKILATDPQNYFVGCLYVLQDEFNKALVFFNDYLTRWPESRFILTMKGVCYAKLGNFEKAETCITELENLKKEYDRGLVPYYQAVVYNLTGEKEKAIELIAQAVNEGKYFDYFSFNFDPYLEDLRNDPRFLSIVHAELH